jgi:hypothetical protein
VQGIEVSRERASPKAAGGKSLDSKNLLVYYL